MKRDRSLLATSALGLMIALSYPVSALADAGPLLESHSGTQAPTGNLLLAQNDRLDSDDSGSRKDRKEKRRDRSEKGQGSEQAPRVKREQGSQQGRRAEGDNHGQSRRQERDEQGRKERRAEQPKASRSNPKAAQDSDQDRKQNQRRLAPKASQSDSEQSSAPRGGGTAQERREHKKDEKSSGQPPKPKSGSGAASQQQPKRLEQGASSGKERQSPASKPSATSKEERDRGDRKHGTETGRQLDEEKGGNNSRQAAPNAEEPKQLQNRSATEKGTQERRERERQSQGEKGQPQLPEQNGMQQTRPDFHGEEGDRNGQANGRRRNAAPIFDSEKRSSREGRGDHGGRDRNSPPPSNGQARGGEAGPAPRSDRAAQKDLKYGKIESIDTIKGRRVDRDKLPPLRRPRGANIVKETDNRVIIQLGDRTVVRNHDRRIAHGARDVYYEDLPHDRRRETVLRRDGSRVITIRNAYGDVIRRSRIMPDGRELVLVYVDDRDLDRDRDDGWRDPGADLPPIRLDVPEDDYILDASEIRSPDRYYEFLEQPPVERVPRLYSIGEVKRSARIRDMIPRIDLDTINFDTGSAEINRSEVEKLQVVAEAIERILKKNPAETFLIEGHTDAVGSDESNLVLSDERAEAVATALTDSFDIPPENLTTQGYGEEFLKVDTDGPNRENRRVTIRRITPLVAPVASNQ